MGPREEGRQEGVDAVDRALVLLNCFDDGTTSLSLAELARRSGLNKTTILRLCASLIQAGFLRRDPTGKYSLGASLWRLGKRYRDAYSLPASIREELRALRDTLQETTSFYVRERDCRICLYREEPRRAIRHALSEGGRLPLTRGASALVLRAFGADADSAMEGVRAAGYAVTRGARDPEVAAVAVPLLADGHLIGALSVSGPINRFDQSRTGEILCALRQSADRILDGIPDRQEEENRSSDQG